MSARLLVTDASWAAIFATAFGVLLTTPPRGLVLCATAGFVGSLVRGAAVASGMRPNWATVVASLAVVFVAALEVRRRRLAPVAIICGVFPLGAAVDIFRTIAWLLRASTAEGDELRDAAIALVSSASRAFTTTLAIALGIGAGLVLRHGLDRRAAGRTESGGAAD